MLALPLRSAAAAVSDRVEGRGRPAEPALPSVSGGGRRGKTTTKPCRIATTAQQRHRRPPPQRHGAAAGQPIRRRLEEGGRDHGRDPFGMLLGPSAALGSTTMSEADEAEVQCSAMGPDPPRDSPIE